MVNLCDRRGILWTWAALGSLFLMVAVRGGMLVFGGPGAALGLMSWYENALVRKCWYETVLVRKCVARICW